MSGPKDLPEAPPRRTVTGNGFGGTTALPGLECRDEAR
jgi:hypothetical protein